MPEFVVLDSTIMNKQKNEFENNIRTLNMNQLSTSLSEINMFLWLINVLVRTILIICTFFNQKIQLFQ